MSLNKKKAIDMKTIMVGYDLNKPSQNYEAVWDYLKGFGTYWHHLGSTWIIKTEKTVVEVRDEINALGLDSNDELFVAELKGTAAWSGFNESGSKWLKDNL